MKKILKAVIAAILAVSMLFSAVSASAVSLLPAISGTDSIIDGTEYKPYKTGYYKSQNQVYFVEDALDSVPCVSDDKLFGLYYLESEKTYIVDGGGYPEFVDTAIARVSINDPAVFDNLILGIDAEEGDTSFSLGTSVGIVFNSGKTVYTSAVPFICENGVAAGENEVKFDFPDYDGESMTVTAHAFENIIRSAELKNARAHTTTYVDYKGGIFYEKPDNAVVVINGTQEIVIDGCGYFIYSSRKYPVYIDTEASEGAAAKMKIYISGGVGDVELASYDCEVAEADEIRNIYRALYYYKEEIEAVKDEVVAKYTAMPSFVQLFMIPIMIMEQFAKSTPPSVEFYSLLVRFYFSALINL